MCLHIIFHNTVRKNSFGLRYIIFSVYDLRKMKNKCFLCLDFFRYGEEFWSIQVGSIFQVGLLGQTMSSCGDHTYTHTQSQYENRGILTFLLTFYSIAMFGVKRVGLEVKQAGFFRQGEEFWEYFRQAQFFQVQTMSAVAMTHTLIHSHSMKTEEYLLSFSLFIWMFCVKRDGLEGKQAVSNIFQF